MSLTFERKDFDEMIKLIVDQAASRIVHEAVFRVLNELGIKPRETSPRISQNQLFKMAGMKIYISG